MKDQENKNTNLKGRLNSSHKKDNIKVLLIEDDDDLRILWEAALAEEFHEVLSAADGAAGLEMATLYTPDIIVSDIMLPKLDGFGLCNALRHNHVTYRIPVILYTSTYIDEKDRRLALGYGAARVLQKNISIHDLIALTREVFTEFQFDAYIKKLGDSVERDDLNELHIERMSEKFTELLDQVRSQKNALRNMVERFSDFASCMSDYFWETDVAGKLVFVATGKRSSLKLSQFGYQGSEFKSYFRRFFKAKQLQRLVEDMQTGLEIESHLVLRSASDEVRIIHVIAKPYYDAHDELAGYRGVFSDITERHRQSELLLHQATHDEMTGLYNRRGLEHGYAELIASSDAKAEHVLCYMDLDGFKVVNDTVGHAGGDKLLGKFADLLRDTARRTDLAVRVGGDEFALFMPNCDIHDSRRLVNELHQKLSDFLFSFNGQSFKVSMSIGCVVTHGLDASLDDLLAEADQACYRAKRSGGDQVCVYSGTLTKTQEVEVARTQLTVDKFRDALEKDQFTLYKQPIVATGDSQIIIGYEIMLRLQYESVVIMPAVILPLAESYSLSVLLDRWVVAHTLHWVSQDRQIKNSGEAIAINLSKGSVCSEKFADDLVRLIKDAPIEAHRLHLEIAEGILQQRPKRVRTFVNKLRPLGVQIVLDDLQIDQLKLSGKLVRGLKNPFQQAVIKGIQSLADALGIDTLAPNVESGEVSRILHNSGVVRQQGYYFAEPIPVAKRIGAVAKNKRSEAS